MRKIITDIIDKNENIVIYDKTLRYYNFYGKQLEKEGYEIKLINLVNPLKSDGYNPIDYLNYKYLKKDSNRLIDLIEDVANNIYQHESVNNDPYWIDTARQMVIGSLLLLLQCYNKTKTGRILDLYSLETVIASAGTKTSNISALKRQISKLDRKDIIKRLLSPIVDAPSETRLSILSVVEQKLNMYLYREDLVNSMKNAAFKVEDINNSKTAIFIVGKKSLNPLVNILLGQIVEETSSKGCKTNFIIDSFDTLPIMDNLGRLLDQINENNSNIYIYTEDRDYLNNNYKGTNLKDRIVENNQLEVTETYKVKELEIKELESFDYPVYIIQSYFIDKD